MSLSKPLGVAVLVGLITGFTSPLSASSQPTPVDLELSTRAAHHRAVEAVRHGYRDWPQANGTPRPSLDSVAPAGLFAEQAAEALRKSRALEELWGRPITGAQLQAEIARMARATKQPDRLAELWRALGNDPYLVAEVLARPLLADRLIREWYAHDERFHGELEARGRAAAAAVSSGSSLDALGGEYSERELTAELAAGRRSPGAATEPSAREAQLERLARGFGKPAGELRAGDVSGLLEDARRFYIVTILERTDDNVRVATVEWRKVPFESWWASLAPGIPATVDTPGYDYTLPSLAGAECVNDTWKPTLSIPEPRYEHTAVWTGAEMIVWGGMSTVGTFPDQNGRYDPATDSWVFVSELGEPGVRAEHTAVWTGTEMIVWGGFGADPANTGGRYDPLTDSWQPTALAGAPTARWSHVAVWTGDEMIVWGGDSAGGTLSSGGRYHPATNTWLPTALAGAPAKREITTAVWTGSEMIVWGGFSDPFTLDTGGRYNPASNSWQPTTQTGAPSFRHFHTAVWTGDEMIVWGGVGEGFGTITGGRYDPTTDSWAPTSLSGTPTPRWLHEAIWTGEEMIIWGGTVLLQDHPTSGGRYDPVADSWTPMSQVNAPEGREDAASVWTGSEMIVWGGLGDDYFVNTGGRYDPAADSWLPTQTYDVPTARGLHTAAWTGAEMMIYGGNLLGEPGGLYDPATDTWRTANQQGAPLGIQNMTSVWTGSEVIVWGGFPETNRGGRYNPLTDSWKKTAGAGAPIPRYWHSAVWTGTEMIVWGGWPSVNTGGRYNPATNSWTPTATAGAPSARDSHTAVWTGSEMIVWGGYPETVAGKNGGRYDPATNTWAPMSTAGSPERRSDASAVWTGAKMIVWGGQSFQDFEVYNSGGRYDPATDSWQTTSLAAAPSPRVTPAVWTGQEMIVWGGDLQSPTGGRYNPLGDNWVPTSQIGAPHGRWNTTLVWTGEEMIAWGGIIETATGGLYCAFLEGNQIPIASDDQYETTTGKQLGVKAPGVLANDNDGDGDPLTASLLTQPANGVVGMRPNGAFRYQPDPGFAGVDQFTYRAFDGEAFSPPATVTVEVECTTSCLRSVLIVIDLLLNSTRSRIWVETETGAKAGGATVFATWTLPNGSKISQSGLTDGTGQATLEIPEKAPGTYHIKIDDITKDGFTFDPVNSVLTWAATR